MAAFIDSADAGRSDLVSLLAAARDQWGRKRPVGPSTTVALRAPPPPSSNSSSQAAGSGD